MTSSACKSDILNFLLVFTVKSSNIEIKTIQWNKYRNWDMKGGKYTKIFAKIQVNSIFHMRDIRRKFVPKFVDLVWRRHVSAHPDGHQHGGRKQTETCYRVLIKKA